VSFVTYGRRTYDITRPQNHRRSALLFSIHVIFELVLLRLRIEAFHHGEVNSPQSPDMIRQKLIDFCDAGPVGVYLLRLLATLLSTIALIAAVVAVVQERPVTTYVDSEEASFGSSWRIPVRGSRNG
jgi:hypothetical protein